MLKSMQKNGLRLSMFALACTGLIVATDYSTHEVIVAQQQSMQARQTQNGRLKDAALSVMTKLILS